MSKAYELATVLGGGTLVTDTDLSTAIAGVGGGGKVLQVVSAMDTSATNTNSTSYQEHSSLSITPTAENSKIFCFGGVEDFFGGNFLRSVGVRE